MKSVNFSEREVFALMNLIAATVDHVKPDYKGVILMELYHALKGKQNDPQKDITGYLEDRAAGILERRKRARRPVSAVGL